MNKFLLILLFAYSLAVSTEGIYEESWALIIGIDKYQNVQGLDYAVKDAQSIQNLMINSLDFSENNITILKNEEATKSRIIQEFSNITKKAGVNDRVLIFFAGHGETEDLPGGGEIGYLLPVDGDQSDLYVTAIEMDELQTISLRSKAKHILYLVDACYGGISTVGARGLDAKVTPNYLEKIIKYKSRQVISAGGRSEKVIEKSEWGHSAFTKNLLSGLREWKADSDDDGFITADELGTYLRRQVPIDSENQQTPVKRRFGNDEGEFVFYKEQESYDSRDDDLIIESIKKTHNDDIFFNLAYYNSESSEISIQMYNPNQSISAFQFSVTGAVVTGVSGGIAQDRGFMLSSAPNSILGFSMSGSLIHSNDNSLRTLLVLKLESSTRMICLDGIIFTDSKGTQLSSNGSDCLITY